MPPVSGSGRTSLLGNLVLLGFAAAFALVLGELIGRLVLDPPLTQRLLLFSEGPWSYDGGYAHFVSDATIRTVAAYGEAIDYDVRFSTNHQGFVDDVDYGAPAGDRRAIALVGDSFTAGYHGGRPWVPRLREAPGFDPARDVLYNFGVAGTGLLDFRDLLHAQSGQRRLDEVLIVAISSDFSRPQRRVVYVGDRVVLCDPSLDDAACARWPTRIFNFPADLGEAELRALIRRKQGADRSFLGRLRAESVWLRLARLLFRRPTLDDTAGVAALAEIRGVLPRARLVLLQPPMKEELQAGEFRSFRPEVEAAGIEFVDGWERCGLAVEDYHVHDSHPNAAGYDKLRACAREALSF